LTWRKIQFGFDYVAITVSYGLYFGFTAAEIATEVANYKAAVKASGSQMAASGGGRIVSGSVGGHNVTFSFPAGVSSLEQWGIELQNAQAQLDDTGIPYPSQTVGGAATVV